MFVPKMISAAVLAVVLGSGAAHAEDFAPIPAIADSVDLEADTLIFSVRLRMPHGDSTYTADLDRVWSANPLKFRYVEEISCKAPSVRLLLRSATDGVWHQPTRTGDVDVHTLAGFDGVKFEINQPYLLDQTCEFRLYGVNDGGPGPAWGTGVLSGGVEYQGGFSGELGVEISAANRIKGFRLAIPEFCQGVEVLEAGTITEGNFDAATLVDAQKRIYQVAAGSVRASRITFTLNGPFDARCFVPVYLYQAQ